jgi:hypothetical protein
MRISITLSMFLGAVKATSPVRLPLIWITPV